MSLLIIDISTMKKSLEDAFQRNPKYNRRCNTFVSLLGDIYLCVSKVDVEIQNSEVRFTPFCKENSNHLSRVKKYIKVSRNHFYKI